MTTDLVEMQTKKVHSSRVGGTWREEDDEGPVFWLTKRLAGRKKGTSSAQACISVHRLSGPTFRLCPSQEATQYIVVFILALLLLIVSAHHDERNVKGETMGTQHKRWGLAVVSVGVVCLGSAALGNGFRNPPEGAAALGHSGGKLVLTEDASAISQNPANLTKLNKTEAEVAVTLVDTKTDYSSPFGSASTDDPWKVLPNLFVATPFDNGNYVAGLGVTTPFGQSMVWDTDGAFRYTAPYFTEMKLVNVNPTLAAKLGDRLSVGVGADVYGSQLDMKQVIPWSMVTGNRLSPDGVVHLQGQGQGIGGNAAIQFSPLAGHTVALTYRSPVKVDYEGDADISAFPAGAQVLGLSPSSDFDTSIEFPAVAALGYAVALSRTVRIEADVEWVEFSRYDELTLDMENNNALQHRPGDPNPMAPLTLRQDWKDTWNFGIGADWDVMPTVTLRAGYIYLDSPIPTETLTPTMPFPAEDIFTVGVGYHPDRHSFNVAYGVSVIDGLDVTDNQNPAYNGKYDTSSQLVSLSYGYTF